VATSELVLEDDERGAKWLTDVVTLRSLGPMKSRSMWILLAALVTVVVSGSPAAAQVSSPADAGFTPRVPVSGLAVPSIAIDPSRLHVSTSVAFGSYGGATSGLSVTSFSYQFRQPLAMSVRVGNAFGGGGRSGFSKSSAFFLEGLDLTYRPSNGFTIHVGYQDLRSPLQRGAYQQSPYSPYWGF
jgi:hypothetical protein